MNNNERAESELNDPASIKAIGVADNHLTVKETYESISEGADVYAKKPHRASSLSSPAKVVG